MYIALDPFGFAVTFTMVFAAVSSVSTGVGGCEWPISARALQMDVAFWQFSNNFPNSASIADAVTYFMIMHSTCTGQFYGFIFLLVCLICASGSNM